MDDRARAGPRAVVAQGTRAPAGAVRDGARDYQSGARAHLRRCACQGTLKRPARSEGLSGWDRSAGAFGEGRCSFARGCTRPWLADVDASSMPELGRAVGEEPQTPAPMMDPPVAAAA